MENAGALYYCPMFCKGMLYDDPDGRCPECRMAFWELAEVLICPDKCEDMVYLDYGGVCDICGKELVAVPIAITADDSSNPLDGCGHEKT